MFFPTVFDEIMTSNDITSMAKESKEKKRKLKRKVKSVDRFT